MSVLIKGMEIPTSCGKCFVGDRSICANGCPLIEVPPHGRLIDEDALKERVTKRLYASNHGSMAEAYFAALIDVIDNAPTIIPAEPPKEET